MTVQTHLDALKLKHRSLDDQIQQGYTNYLDDAGLHKMKQEKMRVKEQIARIEQDME